MAEDARLSTALPAHPKTLKLKKRLGPAGCWSLVCLYLWVASNRSDGNLNGLSDEDVEIAAQWDGEPSAFVRVLSEVRFIDGDSGSYVIHDWAEHNPWAAARGQRVEAAKRAADARWNAPRMRPASAPHETALPPTQPNPTHTKVKSVSDEKQSDEAKHEPPIEAQKLARLLSDEILANKPDAKVTQAQLRDWAKTADRMIRIDHRSSERIEALIRWAQSDEFWRGNILSMKSLRRNFDQVEIKAKSKGGQSSVRSSIFN